MPLFAEEVDPFGMLPYSVAYVLLLSLAGGPILWAAARRAASLELTLYDAWRMYVVVNVAFVVADVVVKQFLLGGKETNPNEGWELRHLGHGVVYTLALAAAISRVYDVPYYRAVWTVLVMTIIAVRAAAIFAGCYLGGVLAREVIWSPIRGG